MLCSPTKSYVRFKDRYIVFSKQPSLRHQNMETWPQVTPPHEKVARGLGEARCLGLSCLWWENRTDETWGINSGGDETSSLGSPTLHIHSGGRTRINQPVWCVDILASCSIRVSAVSIGIRVKPPINSSYQEYNPNVMCTTIRGEWPRGYPRPSGGVSSFLRNPIARRVFRHIFDNHFPVWCMNKIIYKSNDKQRKNIISQWPWYEKETSQRKQYYLRNWQHQSEKEPTLRKVVAIGARLRRESDWLVEVEVSA